MQTAIRSIMGVWEASDLLSSVVEVGFHVRGTNGFGDTGGELGYWTVHTVPLGENAR